MKTPRSLFAWLLALGATQSNAATTVQADTAKSSYDELWSHADLYKNPDHAVLQKLSFTGRVQADYAIVDGEGTVKAGPDRDIDQEFGGWRRVRAGLKATLFEDFTAHAEADFDPDEAPVYQRLTDAYLRWAPCKNFDLTLGKQSMGFTLDGQTSSKELLTVDRNNLSNNLWFTTEYLPGALATLRKDGWSYRGGVFSQGGSDGEFGDFDSGSSWLASVGRDLSSQLDADKAELRLDYVFNEETPATDMFTNRAFGEITSLVFSWEDGPLGFRSDLATGNGFLGQPSTWGLVAMPYYNFNKSLQAVFRYTFLDSDGPDGIRHARYEGLALNSKKGDLYHEAYLGLNWFIYGHKLKVQTGLQYTRMEDEARNGGSFDGWNWTSGLRLSW